MAQIYHATARKCAWRGSNGPRPRDRARDRFLDVGHRHCDVDASSSGVKRLIGAKPSSLTRSRLSPPWGRCWALRAPHWFLQSPSSVLSVLLRQDGRLCCSQRRQGRRAGSRLTTRVSVPTSTAHHIDGCVLFAAAAGEHGATCRHRVWSCNGQCVRPPTAASGAITGPSLCTW